MQEMPQLQLESFLSSSLPWLLSAKHKVAERMHSLKSQTPDNELHCLVLQKIQFLKLKHITAQSFHFTGQFLERH